MTDRGPALSLVIGNPGELPLLVYAIGDSTLSGEGLRTSEETWLALALQEIADDGVTTRPFELQLGAENGARLDDMGRQLSRAPERRPDLIVIAVGTNDVTRLWRLLGLVRYRSRYRRLLAAARSQADRVVISGVGDLSKSPRFDHDLSLIPLWPIAKLASWYVNRQIVKAFDEHRTADRAVDLIQARDADDEMSAGRQWYFTADHFHPGPRGHRVWADLAKPKLRLAIEALTAHDGSESSDDPPSSMATELVHSRMGYACIHRATARSNGGDAAGARARDQTVVLIPDAPNAIEHYEELIECLRDESFDVLALEMPGLGRSETTRRFDFTLRSGADWILSVLDQEGIDDVVIATTCINGLWAAKAAQIDERVKGLVLGQTPDLETIQRWGRDNIPAPLRWPVVGDVLTWLLAAYLTRRWYARTAIDPATASRFEFRAAGARASGARWRFAPLYRAIRREAVDPLEHLEGVCEIRRVWGCGDRSYRHSRITGQDLCIEEAGHFPDLEVSDRFVEQVVAVADALREKEPGGPRPEAEPAR